MNSNDPQKLKGISEISDKFDVYFIDLWGVIHNGVQCYPEALKVLEKLKEQNKKIVLISNAPRPAAVVKVFLETIGLKSSGYDFLVTSGDITREYISLNSSKKNFYHLGPTRDIDLFKDLNVTLTSKEECEEIICTGLVSDEEEKLQDYKILLDFFLNKKIPLICANPDEVVARGEKIVFCAGALANQYKQEGGMVRYFGKPYSEIYSFALKKIRAHKDFKDKKEINTLVIGDNIKTDIKGANLSNLDSVLILNGIYKDFFRDGTVNFDQLKDSVNLKDVKINYFQEELAWH
ncbi:TIGR01459 family HAD-type hydrolase [Pelagibacteraceae bacterium]|jgi:HAD superfamily hydrolase (TIGR01459 family)|nr:TIGR01459 family HAD-type hydrolase [Pelagibacteraceae bacterium]